MRDAAKRPTTKRASITATPIAQSAATASAKVIGALAVVTAADDATASA